MKKPYQGYSKRCGSALSTWTTATLTKQSVRSAAIPARLLRNTRAYSRSTPAWREGLAYFLSDQRRLRPLCQQSIQLGNPARRRRPRRPHCRPHDHRLRFPPSNIWSPKRRALATMDSRTSTKRQLTVVGLCAQNVVLARAARGTGTAKALSAACTTANTASVRLFRPRQPQRLSRPQRMRPSASAWFSKRAALCPSTHA